MSDAVLLTPPSGRLLIADAGMLSHWTEDARATQLNSPPDAAAWALDMAGHPALAVQDLPLGRPIRVERDHGDVQLQVRDDATTTSTHDAGSVHVLIGPLLLLPPEALVAWSRATSHDGRADVIVEGPGAEELATRHGIPKAPGGQWIWRDLREGAAEMFAVRAREARVQTRQHPHTLPQLARNALTSRDLIELHGAVALDVPAGVYAIQLQQDIDQRIIGLHLHGDEHRPPPTQPRPRRRLTLAGTVGCVLLIAVAALLALVALAIQIS